jgi:hypothetical protein
MSTELNCTSARQADALAAVIGERSFQDQKWGPITSRPREVGTYLTLMRKLLADAELAFAESRGDESALDELRKVVAVGVACFEQHGVPSRRRKEPAMNHDGYREGGCTL